MEFTDILGNPLFVPLIVAILTIVTTSYFNYWLRKWQYRREYTIRNVEKTYVPLLAEIDDNLRVFDQYLEDPYFPKWSFEKLEGIRKSGLFEFIKNHNGKLGDKITLLHGNIYPRFGKLDELQQETKKQICEIWTEHISSLLPDAKAKTHSGTFVNYLFANGLYVMLLKGELAKGEGIWYGQISRITNDYDLYTDYVQEKGRILVSHNAKIPTFAPSSNELKTLEKLSHAKVQKLLDYYNQTKDLLDKEVVNGLIPMMQRYVTDPLAK
jgi:hypothetical protein